MYSHLKSKLFAALAMVLIASIMLGTASFAWFTISTAPEISSINATVVSNENLEIVLDNGYTADKIPESDEGDYNDPYTWGNLVNLKVANDAYNFKLIPVKMDGTSFKAATYGSDGSIIVSQALEEILISDHADYTGEKLKGGYTGYYNEDDSAVEALGITYWLRSNEDCDVLLAEPDTFRADDGKNATGTVNAVKGKGSTITFDFTDEVSAAKALASDVDDAFKTWVASKTEANKTALLASEIRFNKALDNDIGMVFGFFREYEDSGKTKEQFYSNATSAMADANAAEFEFKLCSISYDRIYKMLDSIRVIFDVEGGSRLYGAAMSGEYYIPDDWAEYIDPDYTGADESLKYPYRQLYMEDGGVKYYMAKGKMIYSGKQLSDYADRMTGKLTVNLVLSTSSDVIDKDNVANIKGYYDILKTNETATSSWPQAIQDDWLVNKEKPASDAVTKISLTENVPLKIQSYIYLDKSATNAVALTFQDSNAKFNIQFWNPDCKGQAMTVKDSSPTT